MLHLSEDTEPFCEGVDGVDNSGGVFGELLPWDVGFSTSLFKNGGKVLFNEFKIDGHICK